MNVNTNTRSESDEAADIVRYRQGEATLVVTRSWCKGCDLCMASCPPGILSLAGDRRIQVDDMSQCIFCGVCAARCPDFVFSLERVPSAATTVSPTIGQER